MEIKQEYSFEDLKKECWGNAIDTLNDIEEKGLDDVFMDYLETAVFYDDANLPTLTEVNDFLAFEDDYIWECLQPFAEDEEEEEN